MWLNRWFSHQIGMFCIPSRRSCHLRVNSSRAGWGSIGQRNFKNILTWSKQDHPLNLSISVSGGKEINRDCLSRGDWTGNSPNLESPFFERRIVISRSHKGQADRIIISLMGRQRGYHPRSWRKAEANYSFHRVELLGTEAQSGR